MAENEKPLNYTVQQGVAYHTVGNSITRHYVTIGGKRVYVFGHQAGETLTKSQAKKAAKEPTPVDNSKED